MLISLLAVMMICPPFVFVLLWFILRKRVGNRKAFFLTVDLTTILFIFSVHFLLMDLLRISLFWFLVIVICLIIAGFVIRQWRLGERIELWKALRSTWRLSFLIFATGYWLLLFIGVVIHIVALFS
ncbi:DUF3397 domain-containing protein [Bacillaceae bacterium SIJ1]|uniref:DUF3397 domain-containing protein n=1 Tax=Litoribacterium kuwaitense TaxID=1398745 RepID=UPI0013EC3381|nr:DUF3397 domain-containing protein [Litoribacterium kuwaitense]NGP44353.1 DUF3397 domain-containing protein [Litoribacterium kuwaitense]